MRVLVATTELQGTHPGDYAWTVEGELVTAEVEQCASPDRCGCGRGFPGLASSQATSTALVVDHPHISPRDLHDAVREWLDRTGWRALFEQAAEVDDGCEGEYGDVDALLASIADEHVETITKICDAFLVGTVVERDGTVVRARRWSAAA
jgi:hypothetical protein